MPQNPIIPFTGFSKLIFSFSIATVKSFGEKEYLVQQQPCTMAHEI
jgi:hypothetical protein